MAMRHRTRPGHRVSPEHPAPGTNMRRIAAFFLLIAGLAAPLTGAAQAIAERRIAGKVLHLKVTLCESRPRGCAGHMVVEVDREGGHEQVMVQVRLGVPIRRGDDYVLLGTLPGRLVSVVHVTEKGAIVAKSIEVLK